MKLTEENFILHAMKAYDKVSVVSIEEFEDDLGRFLSIKRLLTRYHNDKLDLKERLLLNHIIVVYNMFGSSATNMLLYRVQKEYWPTLITILIYLNRISDTVPEHNLVTSDIPIDQYMAEKLRAL